MILHELKNDEGIRLFLQEVWEAYVKVRLPPPSPVEDPKALLRPPHQTLLNPFHELNAPIRSPTFDSRVRASAKKHL